MVELELLESTTKKRKNMLILIENEIHNLINKG